MNQCLSIFELLLIILIFSASTKGESFVLIPEDNSNEEVLLEGVIVKSSLGKYQLLSECKINEEMEKYLNSVEIKAGELKGSVKQIFSLFQNTYWDLRIQNDISLKIPIYFNISSDVEVKPVLINYEKGHTKRQIFDRILKAGNCKMKIITNNLYIYTKEPESRNGEKVEFVQSERVVRPGNSHTEKN